MVDPPPTATKASKRPCVANSMASRKETSVGSTRTRSNRANWIPLSRRLSCTVAAGARRARFGSVSTITRLAFISARSMPTSRVAPRPTRMLEAASSYAYSRAMAPSSGGLERGNGDQLSGPPPVPEDGDCHRAQDHRDADPGQGREQREGATGQPGEGEADDRQDRDATAGQRAGPGGEPEHAGHRSGDACGPGSLEALAGGEAAAPLVGPEREERTEGEGSEQDSDDRRNVDDESPLDAFHLVVRARPGDRHARQERELLRPGLLRAQVFGQARQPRIEGEEVGRLADEGEDDDRGSQVE